MRAARGQTRHCANSSCLKPLSLELRPKLLKLTHNFILLQNPFRTFFALFRFARRSYQFQYGLLPGVSFFNHDAEKGNVLSKLSNMDDPNFDAGVGTIARVDYAQGDEVYLNYHPTNEIFHGSAQMYYLYGFMPHTAKFDTCVDMSSVRHADHDYHQKLKCIQTLALQSGTSAENLLAEISLAEQHGDGAWAEGGNLALAQILQSLREL